MGNKAEPGWTTTEFWATQAVAVVAEIVALLTAFGVIHWNDTQKASVFALTQTAVLLAEGLYAISRGIRKRDTTA